MNTVGLRPKAELFEHQLMLPGDTARIRRLVEGRFDYLRGVQV